jgi:hypothetical protein
VLVLVIFLVLPRWRREFLVVGWGHGEEREEARGERLQGLAGEDCLLSRECVRLSQVYQTRYDGTRVQCQEDRR